MLPPSKNEKFSYFEDSTNQNFCKGIVRNTNSLYSIDIKQMF
nr:MAG TPA: hypothetical protein [Caudoviricetes sp.]